MVSEDIKDILEGDSSLGLVFGENLFIGKEPPAPRNCVTIYDTYGGPPSLTLQGKEGGFYEYNSIQIKVRNASYPDGYELCYNIMASLHGINHYAVEDTLYTAIICTSGPALLEWDDNGNASFIINFNVQRRRR